MKAKANCLVSWNSNSKKKKEDVKIPEINSEFVHSYRLPELPEIGGRNKGPVSPLIE